MLSPLWSDEAPSPQNVFNRPSLSKHYTPHVSQVPTSDTSSKHLAHTDSHSVSTTHYIPHAS